MKFDEKTKKLVTLSLRECVARAKDVAARRKEYVDAQKKLDNARAHFDGCTENLRAVEKYEAEGTEFLGGLVSGALVVSAYEEADGIIKSSYDITKADIMLRTGDLGKEVIFRIRPESELIK